MKLKFKFEKETKGTLRFKEDAEDYIIGTIYIRKDKAKELDITKDKDLIIEIKEV